MPRSPPLACPSSPTSRPPTCRRGKSAGSAPPRCCWRPGRCGRSTKRPRPPRRGGRGGAGRGGRRPPCRGRCGGGGHAPAAALAQSAPIAARAGGAWPMSAFWQLLGRDVLIAWKEGGSIGIALGFYLVVVVLLPLGLGPDLNLLARIAPGVLWIALLLSALLSLGRLFEADFEDGSLDVLATGALPLEAVAAAKALAHWLTTALPLIGLTPVLGLLLNLNPDAYGVLLATMLAGTPAVSFLGAVGAALTVATRRGGLLLGLLLLPLFVPTLIFGIEAIGAALTGADSFRASFLILTA